MNLTIKLSDIEQQILSDSMLDIEGWLREAVANNIDLATQRLLREWVPRLDYPQVRGGKQGMIVHILNHSEYQSRSEREAPAPVINKPVE